MVLPLAGEQGAGRNGTMWELYKPNIDKARTDQNDNQKGPTAPTRLVAESVMAEQDRANGSDGNHCPTDFGMLRRNHERARPGQAEKAESNPNRAFSGKLHRRFLSRIRTPANMARGAESARNPDILRSPSIAETLFSV